MYVVRQCRVVLCEYFVIVVVVIELCEASCRVMFVE